MITRERRGVRKQPAARHTHIRVHMYSYSYIDATDEPHIINIIRKLASWRFLLSPQWWSIDRALGCRWPSWEMGYMDDERSHLLIIDETRTQIIFAAGLTQEKAKKKNKKFLKEEEITKTHEHVIFNVMVMIIRRYTFGNVPIQDWTYHGERKKNSKRKCYWLKAVRCFRVHAIHFRMCVCGWPFKKNRLARYGSKRGEIPTQKYNNIKKLGDQSFPPPSICIADQRSNFWLAWTCVPLCIQHTDYGGSYYNNLDCSVVVFF